MYKGILETVDDFRQFRDWEPIYNHMGLHLELLAITSKTHFEPHQEKRFENPTLVWLQDLDKIRKQMIAIEYKQGNSMIVTLLDESTANIQGLTSTHLSHCKVVISKEQIENIKTIDNTAITLLAGKLDYGRIKFIYELEEVKDFKPQLLILLQIAFKDKTGVANYLKSRLSLEVNQCLP